MVLPIQQAGDFAKVSKHTCWDMAKAGLRLAKEMLSPIWLGTASGPTAWPVPNCPALRDPAPAVPALARPLGTPLCVPHQQWRC